MPDEQFIQYIFTNYGAIGVAVFLAAIGLIKFAEPIKKMIQIFEWAKIRKSVRQTSHEILLSKLNYWIHLKIPNIRLADAGRQAIMRDILHLKYTRFRQYLKDSEVGFNEELNPRELFEVILESFEKTVDAYEAEAIAMGIPSAVMVKFAEWQLRSYEYTIRATELICMASGYDSNRDRMNAIYSLFMAMMELTIAEAEKTLTELNGELTGVEYKGVICG